MKNSNRSHRNIGISEAVRVRKQILNAIAERAAIEADCSRFAALSSRYLDDVGMTAGERRGARLRGVGNRRLAHRRLASLIAAAQ
jgi:hypothetical protein